MRNLGRLKSWEGLLVVILLATILLNIAQSPFYLGVGNFVNLFHLSIEKIILALTMTLIIINGEIDLSVASVMGMSAGIMAYMWRDGTDVGVGIAVALLAGLIAGTINGFFVAYVGLPSLAVTLAALIGYRGIARVLLENNSIGRFPEWFNTLGQQPFLGPLPFALVVFFVLFVIFFIVLHYTAFGRYVYIIGNNREAARFSGVHVRRVKMTLFMMSGVMAAFAGLLYASRLGNVMGNQAEGFELDIITMVLLGGVSIFGGTGTLVGVGLSILIVLNLRNGMSLVNITGNIQTSVIGTLLILSVLIPNWAREAQQRLRRRRLVTHATEVVVKKEDVTQQTI